MSHVLEIKQLVFVNGESRTIKILDRDYCYARGPYDASFYPMAVEDIRDGFVIQDERRYRIWVDGVDIFENIQSVLDFYRRGFRWELEKNVDIE